MMKWCPVCVFYVATLTGKPCSKCDNECPRCGGELEQGNIPDYMVSSVV